ncbi:MAG: thioredoxin domain-containing protein, partial [Proteobacteria bacterium]|nr:thioredoxin domain-containing protein [Pseudomonadota bacterium]
AGPEAIERWVRALASAFDPEHGGFGRGIKFPRAPDLELLLRYHRRTDDPRARAIVERTLGAMATGGIHDQLGGGFHRYATERAWRIPHFEKMLYDNAQLATLYLAIGQVDVAAETLDYLARELRTADGGFASASDADSRGPDGTSVEGYYYTWTPAEIDAAAGEAAPAARAWFGVGAAQVDGRSVLHVPRTAAAVAAELGIDEPTLAARLASARPAMLAARSTRALPARDDKVVASWNGLAIGAFARAGFALDRADYLAIARRAATLVLAKLRTPDGGLARSYTAGRAGGVATLTDYASVVAGLLDLFAATSERPWLEAALALAAQLEPRFGDRDGGFFMTEGEPILVRGRPIDDGAEPSANAVAALDLVRLAELTGDPTWRARAARLFAAFNAELARGSASALRSALEAYLDDPISIVIVGEPVAAAPLVAEVRRAWLPNASIVVVPVVDPELAKLVPAAEGKRAQHDLPTAYVCVRELCRAPTQDPAALARQLATVAPLYPDRSPSPLPGY